MQDVVIEETKDTIPTDLLLLSDPSEEVIAEYIGSSIKFVERIETTTIGALILLKTRPGTMEIMNISVCEEYQNKGIGETAKKCSN